MIKQASDDWVIQDYNNLLSVAQAAAVAGPDKPGVPEGRTQSAALADSAGDARGR
jgi:hypothetical protein